MDSYERYEQVFQSLHKFLSNGDVDGQTKLRMWNLYIRDSATESRPYRGLIEPGDRTEGHRFPNVGRAPTIAQCLAQITWPKVPSKAEQAEVERQLLELDILLWQAEQVYERGIK